MLILKHVSIRELYMCTYLTIAVTAHNECIRDLPGIFQMNIGKGAIIRISIIYHIKFFMVHPFKKIKGIYLLKALIKYTGKKYSTRIVAKFKTFFFLHFVL